MLPSNGGTLVFSFSPGCFRNQTAKMKENNSTETTGATKATKKAKKTKNVEPTEKEKTDKINSQIVRLLVGDEIAKIADLTKPILKTLSSEVGIMITESLAANLDQIKVGILQHLKDLEEGKTPEALVTAWLKWQSEKVAAAAKALAEASKSKGNKDAANSENNSDTESSSEDSAETQRTAETAESQKAAELHKTVEPQSAARQSEDHSASNV